MICFPLFADLTFIFYIHLNLGPRFFIHLIFTPNNILALLKTHSYLLSSSCFCWAGISFLNCLNYFLWRKVHCPHVFWLLNRRILDGPLWTISLNPCFQLPSSPQVKPLGHPNLGAYFFIISTCLSMFHLLTQHELFEYLPYTQALLQMIWE